MSIIPSSIFVLCIITRILVDFERETFGFGLPLQKYYGDNTYVNFPCIFPTIWWR